MIFNQVISVTEGQTVPEGKTWKVEFILMENQDFEMIANQNSNGNINNSNLFVPSNSYLNIIMEAPNYDSVYMSLSFQAKVLPSGGGDVTDRGFCYSSANQEPNIFDNIIISGSGTGSFEANFNPIDHFEYSTTYYVRSFATSFEGITYSDIYSFTTGSEVSPSIGSPYLGGIVFYLDGTGEHGLVAATEDLGKFQWGCESFSFSGAYGHTYLTGLQNTVDIVNQGCSTVYGGVTAAQAALDAEINGYSDWYLPSIDELVEMYNTIGNGGPQGNIGNFEDAYYWSSTQYDDEHAFDVGFGEGNTDDYSTKDNDYRVRVIRSF